MLALAVGTGLQVMSAASPERPDTGQGRDWNP